MTTKAPDPNDILREHGPDFMREQFNNNSYSFSGSQSHGKRDDTPYESRCVAAIIPAPINWLWKHRIARGKLNIIAGHPGVAKSQITQFMAATVSTGGTWPDGTQSPTGSCVIVSCEDDAADTIVPRLRALDANSSRIHILDYVVREDSEGERSRHLFDLAQDIEALAVMVGDVGDVALIIIDPVSAYFGRLDSHKTSDVRGALAPLQDLAAQTGAAVVLVAHLNKGTADANAMSRISGSMAFVAACRSGWLVENDPNDDTRQRRILAPLKNNIGDDRTGFAFSVETVTLPGGIETSRVVFEVDPVEMSASDLLRSNPQSAEDRSALDEAKDFLRSYLSSGPQNAKSVQQAADQAGISKRTLDRARQQLRVRAQKSKVTQNWVWTIPEQGCQES